MTLDEAIKHASEVAQNATCKECGEQHAQLTEWLKELKNRREMDLSECKHEEKAYIIDLGLWCCDKCGLILPKEAEEVPSEQDNT